MNTVSQAEVSSRAMLINFLRDHHCQTIQEVMGILEPLFAKAMKKELPLAPAKDIDPGEVARSISLVTNWKPTKIILISYQSPCVRPEWMTNQGFTEDIWKNVFFCIQDSIWNNLAVPTKSYHNNEWRMFWSEFWLKNLGKNLFENCGKTLKGRPRSICSTILYHYVGLHLAGETKEAEKFQPLVELLSGCIPFGPKTDEPETLLVLVA